MTIRVRDYFSITSTNNTSSNYGFRAIINDDNTTEVKLTIRTTIRKLKTDDLNVISLHSITVHFRKRSN